MKIDEIKIKREVQVEIKAAALQAPRKIPRITKKEIWLIVGSIILITAAYFSYRAFANATLDVSLQTNPNLQNGLVGYWTLDGKDMLSNVADVSGQGNTGYLSGFTSTTTLSGKIGQALSFDGVNDYVDAGIISTLSGVSQASLAGWIYKKSPTDSVGAGEYLDPQRFAFQWFTDGVVYISIENGLQNWCNFTPPQATGWHHLSIVFDGTQSASNCARIIAYWDGVSQSLTLGHGSIPSTLSSGGSQPAFRMGMDSSGGNRFYGGALDDFRVYNRALSAAEVLRLEQIGATTKIATSVNTNPVLQNGLIGYWTMDGNNLVNNVTDSGSGGNNGILVGITATSSVITPGRMGQAIQFNTTAQYINMGNVLNFTTDYHMTLATWIKVPSIAAVGAGSTIFGKFDNSNPNGGYSLVVDNTGVVYASFGSACFASANCLYMKTTSTLLADGAWHHVAYTDDGTGTIAGSRIYIDGVSQSLTTLSNNMSGTITNTVPFEIGARGTAGAAQANTPCPCIFDDVRVYNRTLSAAEILRLEQVGATTKIATTVNTNPNLQNGLVGYWTFDGPNMINNVVDSSGSGNTGYLLGTNSTSSMVIAGKIGQALDFNGSTNYVGTNSALNTGTTTLTAWVKLRGTCDDFDQIVGTDANGLLTHSNGGCELRYNWANVGGTFTFSSGLQIPKNQWVFVGVTITGANATLYLGNNGTLSSVVNTVTNQAVNFNSINIGRDNDAVGYVTGGIDDVRFYNRALSTSEMQRLYELGK